MPDKTYVYIYIIAGRDLKDDLEEELYQNGGALINCVYGRGYHESRNIWDFLGFGEKKGKAIVSALLSKENSLKMMTALNEKYSFNNPGTGIAFTVPVESIVY